jgi:hypothetical protein
MQMHKPNFVKRIAFAAVAAAMAASLSNCTNIVNYAENSINPNLGPVYDYDIPRKDGGVDHVELKVTFNDFGDAFENMYLNGSNTPLDRADFDKYFAMIYVPKFVTPPGGDDGSSAVDATGDPNTAIRPLSL